MNNDWIDVDELILEIEDAKTSAPIRPPKNFEGVLGQRGAVSIPARPRAR